MNDHPLIYCNGDSYSDENYHPSLVNKTYAHVISEHLNGFVINHAIAGSCNRRIVRSSCHDLIHQRQLNPDQPIFALISLSFELRSELWNENAKAKNSTESNFQTHTFSSRNDWRELLLNDGNLGNKNENKFLSNYSHGRAYYYSPYAERINLLCDLVMFQSLMKQLNVEFLIFQGPVAETLEKEYLLDFFKSNLDKENFLDFENFGFCDWCHKQRFEPLDFKDRPHIGHYGPDAHRAFAEQILIPHITKP